jgi:phosphoribosylanthranilate isomerase
MTRVKICGVRTLDDALTAAQAGADYIGIVFVPNRRRRLEVSAARAITDGVRTAHANSSRLVGLFADQPLAEVNGVIRDAALDAVQLCGSESLDYCDQVDAQVIKVVHVTATSEDIASLAERMTDYQMAGHLVTLDRMVDGLQGGTGQAFDWDIAALLAQRGHSFLLAGGLTPDNVADAVAQVRPWGVDVSSGVETDGVQDQDKIRAFVGRAREAPDPFKPHGGQPDIRGI